MAGLSRRAVNRLGKVNDRQLAAEESVSVSVIRNQRRERGIPPAIRGNWTPQNTALLGTMPDAQLAAKLGITANAVFSRRE